MNQIVNHKMQLSERDYKVNFIVFFLSQIISEFGTATFNFALNLYILDITGSATLFATMLTFTMIPGLLVNMFGGFLIDRSNKKIIVTTFDLFSGVIVLVFAVIFNLISTNIAVIFFIVLLLSTSQAIFMLSMTASISNLASESKVVKFNSLFQGISALTRIVGPVSGAFLYNLFGLHIIVIINAVSFLISGLLDFNFKFNVNQTISKTRLSYKESVKNVRDFVNGKPGMSTLLILSLVNTLVFGAMTSLVLPFITYDKIMLSEYQVSFIMSFSFIGLILGTITISTKGNFAKLFKKIVLFFRLQLFVCVFWAFPLLPLFQNLSKWMVTYVFCILMLIIGILVGFINIPVLTYIQTTTPEESRASFIGVVNTLGKLATPIGVWIYGFMLENIHWGFVVTIPTILLIIGITFIGKTKKLKNFFNSIKGE